MHQGQLRWSDLTNVCIAFLHQSKEWQLSSTSSCYFPKCQQPCSQDNVFSDNGEEPCAVLLDIAANEYNRRCTCQSAQAESLDNIITRKERLLLHPESQGNSTRRRTSHKPMPLSKTQCVSTGIWRTGVARTLSDPYNFLENEQTAQEASCESSESTRT